jgi:predicted esterase
MVGKAPVAGVLAVVLSLCACSSGDDAEQLSGSRGGERVTASNPAGSAASTPSPFSGDPNMPIVPPGASATPGAAPGVDAPGPAPAEECGLAKGQFFTRSSGQGSYVGFVPNGYAGQPTRLLVGLHGCGDNAWNFASWGVNPYDTRDAQDYIGIAIDGASGGGSCWDTSDEAKVLAAIDDVSRCLYVHQQKIVIAGFSSGGELAYGVGLRNASRFAGILIENATLSAAGDPAQLIGSAAWNINVAHRAHTQDGVFPIDTVHDDWALLRNAGFPISSSEVDGDHNGSSQDWTGWLLPQMATWQRP